MTRITLPAILLLSVVFKTHAQVGPIRKEFLNPTSKNVLVASHRAVHHELPENSLPAIKEAIRLGVDIIEIDVKVSKDGIPMLMHDGKVDRTTTGKGDLETQNLRSAAEATSRIQWQNHRRNDPDIGRSPASCKRPHSGRSGPENRPNRKRSLKW